MNAPGVYAIYGEDGTCLYVGSSINMRQRMSTHKYRKLAHRVDFKPFPVAELRDREEHYVLTLKPTLNRTLRIIRPGQSLPLFADNEQPGIFSWFDQWHWQLYGVTIRFNSISAALEGAQRLKPLLDAGLRDVLKDAAISTFGKMRQTFE